MADSAFVKRESCGCVSAIVVEDLDTMHYVHTVAAWKRAQAVIERVTVEHGREELTQTFQFHASAKQRRNWVTCGRTPAAAVGNAVISLGGRTNA